MTVIRIQTQRRNLYSAVFVLLLLLFFLCLQTSVGYGATKQMYFKEAGCSVFYRSEQYGCIMGVFGAGEVVAVDHKSKCRDQNGMVQTYYETRFFGEKAYINSKYLTARKPKTAYRITNCFKKIVLCKRVTVYSQPKINSKKRICRERTICTIGQTSKWYKVFIDGKVGFIPKTSDAVLRTVASEIPLKMNQPKVRRKNVRYRALYQYAMLSDTTREKMQDRRLSICIGTRLPNPAFEKAGCSGYAVSRRQKPSVYLKEAGHPYLLECSFLHEIGHILTRLEPEILDTSGKAFAKCFTERTRLHLGPHYQTPAEYAAEVFAIYVLRPQWLKKTAPNSFAYIKRLCTKK